jgi:FkbM family methyltransferase
MILDAADLFRDVYFFGTYEPEITNLILRTLRPGNVAFDIGANAGYYSLLMAGIVGDSGQVHSFEPNPKLAAMLKESLVVNSFERRVCVNSVAVGARTEHGLEFFVSQLPENSGISSLKPHAWAIASSAYADNKILVDTTTLDEYVRAHGIERCDLIKIDVEGTEDSVLRGMSTVMCRLRPHVIICETSACGIADELLRGGGYKRHAPTASGLLEVSDESFWGNLVYTS